MERKTKVDAEDARQELLITRDFELPVELLFKAYTEPEIVEQWMSTTVLQLENKKHGAWHFQKSNDAGQVVFDASGVYHEFLPEKKITRTFQMTNAPFDAQIEYLEFEALSEEKSRLTMHIVYRSVKDRDQMLKMGMGAGMSMAHDRLQNVVQQLR